MLKTFMYFSIIGVGIFKLSNYAYSDRVLFDAAFAPNWNMIGLATSDSFRIYDPEIKQQFYNFPLEKGAHFIKWSPDHNLVLLMSGENENGAFYLVLDWQKRKILCSFQDKVRWYYNHFTSGNHPDEIYYGLEEKIIPIATQIGHPNSMAISPDNREFAYISNEGNIRIRDIQSGAIKKEFPILKYHLSSLGYTPDGNQLWAGNIYTNNEDRKNPNYLIYIDVADGNITNIKNVGYDHLIYTVRDDQKFALALGMGYYEYATPWEPSIPNFIIDLQKDVNLFENTLRFYTVDSVDYIGRFRSVFSGMDKIVSTGQSNFDSVYPFLVYDYQQITKIYYWDAFSFSTDSSLSSHPISPDGRQVIFINWSQMFLLDYFSQTVEKVQIEPAQVEDYQQHEISPSFKEEQNER